MANLTKNLELLQTGKQKIIDKINSKLAEKDQEKLEVTCLWEEINELLAKIKIKKDRSEELDTSEIYSEIPHMEVIAKIIMQDPKETSIDFYINSDFLVGSKGKALKFIKDTLQKIEAKYEFKGGSLHK